MIPAPELTALPVLPALRVGLIGTGFIAAFPSAIRCTQARAIRREADSIPVSTPLPCVGHGAPTDDGMPRHDLRSNRVGLV